MIRCTRNLLLILVAAFTLTGCTSLAPRMAGPQFTGEIVASAAIAGGAPATEVMITPTRVASATSSPTASPTHTVSSTVQSKATSSATASASPTQPAPTSTPAPTVPSTPAATATPEPPAVMVESAANVRSGPSTAYPIIGGARVGQRLPVIGQYGDWWQITFAGRTGWIWGALVTPNAAAQQAPQVKDLPPPPTSRPRLRLSEPAHHGLDLTSASPSPTWWSSDRTRSIRCAPGSIRGWDYELVDLSTGYDFVVHRDVFGMLAHQLDDENVQRYRRQSRFARSGPIRITLVDAQPHPDPDCPGWGWAPDRDTFVDPYGMTQDPCRVEHSLFPQGDGAGTTLLIGWGYNAGTTLAIGAVGPYLADVSTTLPRRDAALAGNSRPGGPAGFHPAALSAAGRGAPGGRPLGLAGCVCGRSCRRGGEMRACAGPCLLQRACAGVSRRLTFVAIDDFILRKHTSRRTR